MSSSTSADSAVGNAAVATSGGDKTKVHHACAPHSPELHGQAVHLLSSKQGACSAGGTTVEAKHIKGGTKKITDAAEQSSEGEGAGGNQLHKEAVGILSGPKQAAGRTDVALAGDPYAMTGGGGPGADTPPQQGSAVAAKPGDQSQGKDHIVVPPLYGQQGAFDAKKSVADLMHEGKFTDATQNVSDQSYAKLKTGESPKISVVYENKDNNVNPPPPQPNYVVGKDGSVKVVHNPEGNPPDANVIVQVQRDLGQTTGPTAQQQKTVDDLVSYEGARIQEQYGDKLHDVQTSHGPIKQVDINDPQALVSDNVAQQFGDRLPPETKLDQVPAPPPVPPDVQNTSNTMDRVPGSGGRTTIPRESAPGRQPGDPSTPAGIDQMIPQREVPQAPSEPRAIVSLKDMAAALFDPDRAEPYSTVKESPGFGYRVGRYGMNQGFSLMGLAEMLGIDLGDPPDMSKLTEYLKEHPDALQKAVHQYADQLRQDADKKHLPADDKLRQSADNLDKFATKLGDQQFAQGFTKFLGDMNHTGDPITKDRVNQFMPKELQEAIAQGGIDHLAKQMNIDANKLSAADAGKIATGMFLGHTPNAQDMSNPEFQRFCDAAGNMYQLANARQDSLGDVDVSDAQGKIAVAANHNVGQQLWRKYMGDGNLGCAASVANVLNQSGFSYANSCSVRGLESQLLAHGWHMDSSAHAGDVICGYRGGNTSGSAHCGIVGTDGMSYDNHSSTGQWGPDSLGRWTTSSFHAGVHFLRPPGADS